MSGQPDLVLQLAHHIARDFESMGHDDVEVRADTLVSLNGRRAAPMIDPDVNLVNVDDGVCGSQRWIAPSRRLGILCPRIPTSAGTISPDMGARSSSERTRRERAGFGTRGLGAPV